MLDVLLTILGIVLIMTGLPLTIRKYILDLDYPGLKIWSLSFVFNQWPGLFLTKDHSGKWFYKGPEEKIIFLSWKHKILGLLFLVIGALLIYTVCTTDIQVSLIIR